MCGGNRDTLREKVRERPEAREKVDPKELEDLRQRVAEMEKEIHHGAKRLLRAPDDIADLLQAELSNLRREKERLSAELADLERREPINIEAETDTVVNELWAMADEFDTDDKPRLRELIRRMVARIDLNFDAVQRGKRTERPVTGGTMSQRPDPLFSSVASTPAYRAEKTLSRGYQRNVYLLQQIQLPCDVILFNWQRCGKAINQQEMLASFGGKAANAQPG